MVAVGEENMGGLTILESIKKYDEINAKLLQEKYGGDKELYYGLNIVMVRLCGQQCVTQIRSGVMRPEQVLKVAKENLSQNITVVGITEEMDR